MPHCASLKRDRELNSIETWFPSLPPSYSWCWGLSGLCGWQAPHEAPASCSVQEFQSTLQTRVPFLTITANRICPPSLVPGSGQPCVSLVRFLEITGEESTPVRWSGLQCTRAQQSNGWKQGQTLGKTRSIFIQTGSDLLHILSPETAGNGQLEVMLHFS